MVTAHGPTTGEMAGYYRHLNDSVHLAAMSDAQGILQAIVAAAEAGVPPVSAAKCREPMAKEYFEQEVRPLLGSGVKWLGEVDRDRKLTLLAAARALLFPICWEEPFGIVMIEAMACGTPVLALRRGSVPEVVTSGESGFIGDHPSELAGAPRAVGRLSPKRCREEALRRFDVDLMAARYEGIYHTVASAQSTTGDSAGTVVCPQSTPFGVSPSRRTR